MMHAFQPPVLVVLADVGHMDGIGWTMMITMWVTIVAGIGALVWLVTRDGTSSRRQDTSQALAILDERYARGDIDEDEYRRRAEQIRIRP